MSFQGFHLAIAIRGAKQFKHAKEINVLHKYNYESYDKDKAESKILS